MKRLIGLILPLLLILAPPGTLAAAPVTSAHATTELVARAQGATPGATVWVAVVQSLDKGWHTYWRNPGDAGEATTIRWTVPDGWRAGAIAWPPPTRLPVGPIMNYGYEGRVVLPVPLQVPASARPGDVGHLSAVVDYLVCAEVCVPGTANVDLTLPVVAGPAPIDPTWGPVIETALSRTPKPAGLDATFQATGATVRLAVAGRAIAGRSARDAYFFPYEETLIDHAKPQTLDRGPRGVTLTLSPGPAFAKGPAPTMATGVLEIDGRAWEVAARPGPPPEGAAGLGPAPRATSPSAPGAAVLLAIGGAFLGGLILNLMPCVFPILSMKAAALAGHAGEAGRARAQALAFLAGVLVSFLGLAGSLILARQAGDAVGWGFQLQSPLAVALLGLVMFGAALNLSGLFEIGTSAQGLGAGLASRGDMLGALFTGVLAVVVAAPCTAPFMGPALGFALTQPAPVALAVFLFLGLGFAAPFTLLSMSPALIRRLPRPGRWMDVLKRALAFPMYAAAAWLAWVLTRQSGADGLARLLASAVALALGAWLFGMAQRNAAVNGARSAMGLGAGAALAAATAVGLVALAPYTAAAQPGAARLASVGEIQPEPWSVEKVAALRAAHRPVFVNFTAAWCVTCQVNERLAFSSDEVARAFKRTGAVYLVADWTDRDAAIADALREQDRIGVPLYLVYGVGAETPRVLPQLLTPRLVADAVDTAARPGA